MPDAIEELAAIVREPEPKWREMAFEGWRRQWVDQVAMVLHFEPEVLDQRDYCEARKLAAMKALGLDIARHVVTVREERPNLGLPGADITYFATILLKEPRRHG